MERHVCIHGHFYQPPRENPWLEDIELQDSAYPFHDWNERITAESYLPNGFSRILDGEGRIVDIVNNYSRISFNFGPTLLSWMEKHSRPAYQAILEADRQSRERFSGHGTAIAQAHGHLIMPLASRRDKRTQVLWGLADFRHRFGRDAEGMWLPETAVDLETLDLMAEQGLRFTILSPYQAARVRRGGRGKWQEVGGGRIDPRLPYLCRLPSGRSISLFFYDGPVARDVAFGGLLAQGENLAHRLLGTLGDPRSPLLAHIATDGETYGHHHRFGDMALAYALRHIEEHRLARLTIYGEYLEQHPPAHEVEIFENTSWSCAHGVERWRADCGCRIGGAHWHQGWRAPLRQALDWLAGRLAPLYEREMGRLSTDPWRARDEYIEVLLDRSRAPAFLARQAGRPLSGEESVMARRLLEMQRHAQLMYTSCGWFFDELSGIETVQVLHYAGRALQLAQDVTGNDLEEEFLQRLAQAPSNLPQWQNGARIYEQMVRPARIDLIRVAAHHAITAQFHEEEEVAGIFCYRAERDLGDRLRAGRMKLDIGRSRIRSEITGSEGEFNYAVLHLGSHNLNAGIGPFRGETEYIAMRQDMVRAFERNDFAGIIRLMDRYFGNHNYTLWHLFRDEQRRVLNQIMAQTLEDIETSFRQIYENHFPLLLFLKEISMPAPAPMAMPVEQVLNGRLRRLLERDPPDPAGLRQLGEEMRLVGAALDQTGLQLPAGRLLSRMTRQLAQAPEDRRLARDLDEILEVFGRLCLEADLWQAQNHFFTLWRQVREGLSESQRAIYRRLGEKLRIRMEP